jgi:MraZ protein
VEYFLSTFTNRIDKKGRISVPAEFRAILARRGSSRLFANKSIRYPCVDAFGEDYVDSIMKRIREMEYDTDEQDDYLDTTTAGILPVSWDGEGRIVLPEPMIAHAQLSDMAAFVGRGDSFAIWNPALFEARQTEARTRQQTRRQGAGK